MSGERSPAHRSPLTAHLRLQLLFDLLSPEQLPVAAIPGRELRVGPLFDHAAALEHDDAIGFPDRREAVRRARELELLAP